MKKTKFDYQDVTELLIGRDVIVGLKGGANVGGKVAYLDEKTMVLVNEPSSVLDIETQVVHTLVNLKEVLFIQFKTPVEK